ncbi:hypothetical protein HPB52_009531 [Rhipicephalus sanguineus]|uniref:Regulatory protein zeste n=1 Tax=Rhipicephalus sanguineus TaxID=34632 RepID=A0A9D4QE00_RHISA|nr:hypothetical protein HPB52_009531 [Rhipicephalus sanguineus]
MEQHTDVRGPRVPDNQRELLLSFMEQHPELAVRASELTYEFTAGDRRRLWGELSDALNSEGPVTKSAEQWQDWWRKQVHDARRDAAAVAEVQRITHLLPDGAGPQTPAAAEPAATPTDAPTAPPRQRRPRRVDVLTDIQAQCAENLFQGTDLLRVAEAMRSSIEQLAIVAERNTALLRRTAEAAERAADAQEALLAELRGRASLQGPAGRDTD